MATLSESLRVVVVDDEKLVADTLGEILAQHGMEVTVCYDPMLAISTGRMLHPQVLISDIVMPEMNGFQLPRHYAEHHPECRVLLISGNVTTTLLAEETEGLCCSLEVLQKPVHPTKILDFIDSCVPAT